MLTRILVPLEMIRCCGHECESDKMAVGHAFDSLSKYTLPDLHICKVPGINEGVAWELIDLERGVSKG